MAIQHNLVIRQGEDFSRSFVARRNGALIDITGYTIQSDIRKSVDAADPTERFDGSIVDGPAGLFYLSMPGARTAQIPAGKTRYSRRSRYEYDVKLTSPSGALFVPVEGLVEVDPSATRPDGVLVPGDPVPPGVVTLAQFAAYQAQINASLSNLSAGTITKLSGAAIGGGRVVRYVDGEHVAIASADSLGDLEWMAGVTLNAVSAAEQEIQLRRLGEIADSGWTWTPGAPIYLSTNGVLTQTYSSSWAFVLVVGTALSPTSIVVDFRFPIIQG